MMQEQGVIKKIHATGKMREIMADYFADGRLTAKKFINDGMPEFVDFNGWVID